MGHLAHNSNLSIKAILALAAYGDMCKLKGDTAAATKNTRSWPRTTPSIGRRWRTRATTRCWLSTSREHWSQKYNLVWDKILKLERLPAGRGGEGNRLLQERAGQPYGLPLDSRTKGTKTDWTIWSATLADNQMDFEALIAPIVKYLDHTTARQPFADQYNTDKIGSVGMHARPVIGGVFIKMLADRALWTKWAGLDKAKADHWAPLPPKPTITDIIPTSQKDPQRWRDTTDAPPEGWTAANFDDQSWKEGMGAFGNDVPHHTDWKSADIWIRRTWTLPAGSFHHLEFNLMHDEDIEVYVDGVLAAKEPGYINGYDVFEIKPEALALLKPGAKVTIAAHCHQTVGGQGIDVGLVDVTP